MTKVLLIDDDPDTLELLTYHFEGAGYQVFTAATGVAGLHEARRHLPDVIVLDLLLPDLDGMSICEILRRQPSTSDIPVLMFTAVEGQICRLAGLDAGADDFVTKLSRPRDVVARAKALMAKKPSRLAVDPS